MYSMSKTNIKGKLRNLNLLKQIQDRTETYTYPNICYNIWPYNES